MRTFMLGPAAFFFGVGGLGFWLAQQKAKKVKLLQQEELDVSQVQAAASCKVLGVIQAPADPMVAPLSGVKCAYYKVLVQELVGHGRNRRWATVYTEERGTTLVLKDRKGAATIPVQLSGAEVAVHAEGGSDEFTVLNEYLTSRGQSAFLGRGELRANETTLTAGEKVFVLAQAAERSPGDLVLRKGDGPFIVSDQDAGQIGYDANNAMYTTRFWAGAAGALGLFCLWRAM